MLNKFTKGKIYLFAVILLSSLILTSCSLPFSDKFSWDWQNEIVMGHECGEDGLACCLNMEPSCYHGLVCCENPANPKVNMCADNCNCGEKGNFCCSGENMCGDGLACVNDICLDCGYDSQPCCSNSTCNGGLVCDNSICKQCGLESNPCCNSGSACENEKMSDETRTGCIAGYCRSCGSAGRELCPADPVCYPGLLANNGMCIKCGGKNQPCCAAEPRCDTDKKLECKLGFCSE